MNLKIAIIGAGPAGLSAAYYLRNNKKFRIDLYEADSTVGGMAKSFELWGQVVDLGPHRFFSQDKMINEIWFEASKGEYLWVDRLTRIYYKHKYYSYPLKPFEALCKLGIKESFLCLFSYMKTLIIPIKGKHFESWVSNRFGSRLYRIFFKTYSEKLWGIRCTALDEQFASQRIRKFSLFQALLQIFKIGNNHKHKTLVDRFAYPLMGAGKIYENMAQDIVSNGHKIFLNEKITTLDYSNKKYQLKTSQGREQEYDYIISSMPLTTLVRCLGNPPMDIVKACDALRFRSTILVYLKINLSDLFQDQWIYIHSEKVKVGRITNFKNWCIPVNKEQQSTIISMEYWCQEDDQFWNMSETDLIQLAKKEIVELNIAEESDIDLGHIHKIKKCYPIYEVNYQEQLNPIQEYLKKFDRLYPIGRYGSFKYNNQDHSILMGILSAKKILGQHKQSLWDINSDYDYQEDAKVEVS